MKATTARTLASRPGPADFIPLVTTLVVLLCAASPGPAASAADRDEIIPVEQWHDPPPDLRPVARWWWPGGSVDSKVLQGQLRQIKDAGFGTVELQPLLLGLGDDDLAVDPLLRSVGRPGFAGLVASAVTTAGKVGLDFDLTLGSGWPGGLPTGKQNAESQLLMATLDLSGPLHYRGPLPPPPDQAYRRKVEWMLDVLGPPDAESSVVAVLAARTGQARDGVATLEDVRVISNNAIAGHLDWQVPAGDWRIFALYRNSTEHFVMGGAYPGSEKDARVVDHLSERGADALLDGYAGPILDSIDEGNVRALFVDSLELMGQLPFTADFMSEFRQRAGYDLAPRLPFLFRSGGESKYAEMIDLFGRSGQPLYLDAQQGRAERIREDYESVRRALFEERFVSRIADWAHDRNLELRLQAHGGYGDYLDTYALADVPESEGLFAGGSFDFLKLASSAAHVSGRRWASSESFITMRLLGTRLAHEDMYMLAGRAYSAGINRLVFHGVPYPYTRADGRTWYPFSGGFGRILAGPFPMTSRIDAAQLARLSDFNLFLGRLSVAMGRGQPAADLAWLRSERVFPDSVSLQLGRIDPREGESDTTAALRQRGLVHDRVSRRMLSLAHVSGGELHVGTAKYRALLLDPLEIAEPGLVENIANIAEAGIPVLALGTLPRRAPGLLDAELRDSRVREATEMLAARVVLASEPGKLQALLGQHVAGMLVEPPPGERLSVSLERRHSPTGDTLLVFNESWSPTTARLRFTRARKNLTAWNPRTGSIDLLRQTVEQGYTLELELEPAQVMVLTLEISP